MTASATTTTTAPANRGSLEPWLLDEINFYQHQVDGVRQLSAMRSALLADEMGLGKSLQTLAVFCLDIKRGKGETMIVVCPASLKANWLEETQKFTRVYAAVLTNKGGPKGREKQIAEFAERTGPKILIVNYEQVAPHIESLNRIRFHLVAFDEAHMLKNPKTRRTQAAMKLMTTRSLLLTGSPLLNNVNELYTLLNRISPGEWGSYHGFLHRYAVYGGFENKSIVGVKNEKELNVRLAAVMVRRLKADVLDLPEVQYIRKFVDLHPRQRTLYREVHEDFKLTDAHGKVDDVENTLTRFLRLKQICGTTAAVPNACDDHSLKLDMAADDARQILDSGHRVVAFTQFRGVLSAYHRRMYGVGVTANRYPIYILNGDIPSEPDGRDPSDPKKKWSRQEIVHAWANNPKPGLLIATFAVAGVGLNMTAARYGQFLDKLYVPALNQQAVDRMHRIGASSSQPVQILEYLCKGTVEERVEKILTGKKKVFGRLVEGSALTSKMIQQLLDEDASEL